MMQASWIMLLVLGTGLALQARADVASAIVVESFESATLPASFMADAGSVVTVTLETLLNEMTDRDALARWPQPEYRLLQASSYDRQSKTPTNAAGWFANGDWSQFIRMENRQDRYEWVMMDADGPGAVVRFWTGGKDATGTVRFYMDGATEPALEGQLQDILCGRGIIPKPLAVENPERAGNSFLPVPYARHCTITYEETNPRNPSVRPELRWYNIEYRAYPAGVEVKTFTLEAFNSARVAIEGVCKSLAGSESVEAGQPTLLDRIIGPGEEATAVLPDGPAAVRMLEFRLGSTNALVLRTMILRAEFDGEDTIWCPLGDFAGSGIGLNVLNSWTRTVGKDGGMTCRWVMPYRTSARISLLNLGQQPVSARVSGTVGEWRWDERSMHFHANWRQQYPIETRPQFDWNFITITGNGVYVGDVLCVFNGPELGWWGEGDEKIYVDGESFPSHFGTGTEDYYGYAFGSVKLFQSPFANQVRCDGLYNKGHAVVTRTRVLDAIPFSQSLRFDMEIWHMKPCVVGYAATTYWYTRPGGTSNRGPEPAEAARDLLPWNGPPNPDPLKEP